MGLQKDNKRFPKVGGTIWRVPIVRSAADSGLYGVPRFMEATM